MRILSRSFLASYLGLFGAILGGGLLALSVIEWMLHLDDIRAAGGGLSGAARWLAIRIPSYYLRDLLPLASFGAAFLCLGLPARRCELTAIQAGGIPPLRVALPVLSAALGLSVAALLASETWGLSATQARSRPDSLQDDLSLLRGPVWYHRGDRIYNVGSGNPEQHSLRDLELYTLQAGGRLASWLMAASARRDEAARWRLREVTVVDFAGAVPRAERRAQAVLDPAAGPGPPEAEALPLPALRDWLEDPDRAAGPAAVRARAVLHARLADPLGVALFALLALPLGLSVSRTRSLAAPLLRGAVVLGAFYSLRALGSLLALAGLAWAAAAPWWLALGFAALGAWQLRGAGRSL